MGATNPREAAPGTIRGDLALETQENLVHGSDGPSPPPARSRSSSPVSDLVRTLSIADQRRRRITVSNSRAKFATSATRT